MSRKVQNKIFVGDKTIYSANTPNGWSIVIMPDNILIDNYHTGSVHIHPDPKNHIFTVKLRQQTKDEIFEIIKDYLSVSGVLDVEELMEMLK